MADGFGAFDLGLLGTVAATGGALLTELVRRLVPSKDRVLEDGASMRSELRAAVAELQGEVRSLRLEVDGWQLRYYDLQAAHTGLQAAHTALQVAHTTLGSEVAGLRHSISSPMAAPAAAPL